MIASPSALLKAFPASRACTLKKYFHGNLAAFSPLHRHSFTQRVVHSHSASKYLRSSTSSQECSTHDEQILLDSNDHLLDPYDILRNLHPNRTESTIPLPTHLSPTSLDLFRKCPQAFFFQYILKLTPDPPTTPALARGTCCHTALEEVFDLKPSERTLGSLQNLFRRAWGKKRGMRDAKESVNNGDINRSKSLKHSDYDCLFRTPDNEYDIEQEIEWGKTSLDLLANYYELEDPMSKNPITREMWVHAHFNIDNETSFVIRGIIDRIDMFLDKHSDKVQLQIIDYKTGKKPHFKYSQPVNERIEKEQFFNMRLYALILTKMIRETDNTNYSNEDGLDDQTDMSGYKYRLPWNLQQKILQALGRDGNSKSNTQLSAMIDFLPLRLLYLTSHLDDDSANNAIGITNELGKASYLDTELEPVHQTLSETEQEVIKICQEIKELVGMQNPLKFQHCDRKFCNCHDMRARFRYGSVWSAE
eukprot:scaffold83210_cov62-Cyclotella_meneghiniana.AAC.6